MASNIVVLDELLVRMTKQVDNIDTEEAHQKADYCLTLLVKHLSESNMEKEKILSILDQYRKVQKWYA